MSSIATCSASSCTNAGTLVCTGCTTPASRYCSKECQKLDWKAHKVRCASAQKSNCYLIRATADSSNFAAHVESFLLNDYGTEKGERAELKRRLGWVVIDEVGKFYDQKGSDTWYYYVYGPHQSSSANISTKNEVASLCCGRTVYGDVVVIRSGPADSIDIREKFTKAELVKTLEFYRTEDTRDVFSQREKSRASRKLGIDLEGVPHMSVIG